MLWICDENRHTDALFIAEQCLHSVKVFSASPTALPVSGLGVHKRLRGETAGRDDPSWPKRYSKPYGAMLSSETGHGGGGSELLFLHFLRSSWAAVGCWWATGILFAYLAFLSLFCFLSFIFCCVTGISLGGEWGVEGLCAMICKLVCLFVCFLTIIPSLSWSKI